MPLDDFDLGDGLAEFSTRRLRLVFGLLGLIAGGFLGGWLGYVTNGILGLLGGGIFGAGLGGGAAWLFAGYLLFGFIMIMVILIALVWSWLTGQS